MKEPRWDQPRPSQKDIDALWARADLFTPVAFAAPALDKLLATMRTMLTHGGAQFAMFALADDPALHWFISRNRPSEIAFFEHFLCSSALRASLPDLETPPTLDPVPWEWSSPFVLGGDIAAALAYGGAYGHFPGSGRDAKNLAERACDALYEDRFGDILVYKTTHPWSDWFSAIGWDSTWIGIDRAERKIWLICITDTD